MSGRQSQFWDVEEDELLWKAINEFGYLTNEQLSTLLPRRMPVNIRRRIKLLKLQGGPVSRIPPHIWSKEDDQELLRLIADETNSWSAIAETMGSEITRFSCIGRYNRLKELNPQLRRARTSYRGKSVRWKETRFSIEQIEQYRKLLDSQTLIGKFGERLSTEVVAKIREDRAKGKTFVQIAKDHGLTKSRARHHCTKSLKPKRRCCIPSLNQTIRESYTPLAYHPRIISTSIRFISRLYHR